MKYVKKPVIVEAVRLEWSEESMKEAFLFVHPEARNKPTSFIRRKVESIKELDGMYIRTLEGEMRARFGDYIIKGVNGEFYPCKPDIFVKTYEPANITAEILSFDPDEENIPLSMLEKKVSDFYD